ncbi:MAG TPA: FtsX-like permease family protein [Opitutus sp.]|nr:FtsX-like permease family protein [Opitutus sp.]
MISPNLRIALRFLTAKKRAMLMSLSCTVLGVGLFIVTQATTGGFEDFFVKTILSADGAMRIEDKIQDTLRSLDAKSGANFLMGHQEGLRYIEGIEQPDEIVAALQQFANVSGTSVVLRGNVVVRSSFRSDSAQVFGINLADHLKVSDLGHQIFEGQLETFREAPTGALVGRVLAERLELQVGDSILLEARGQSRRYRVSAIYETGIRDIDKVRVYVHMNEARSLLRKPSGATFIQVNLRDKDRAPAEADHIQDVLSYSARSWQEREKPWLSAFGALRISSAITMSVFILIAGLAMFNTLAMIVLEKTREIAILRSMGYERSDITRIFLWQAAIVLAIGALVGSLFGAATTFAVSHTPLPHGGISGIFATKYFRVAWSAWHYAEGVALATIMVMLASIIPARRAARLEPGDVIRGAAQ